jgi:outer membrane protein
MKTKDPKRWIGCLLLVFIGIALPVICRADQSALEKLSLHQAIEMAMKNSLQRRVAQDGVRIARDKIAQSFSAYGPTVTVDGGYNHYNEVPSEVQLKKGLVDLNNILSQSFPNYHISTQQEPSDSLDYYGYEVQLTQPLYTGHKLTAIKDQAKANGKNAEANLNGTENDLVMEVQKAYYTVLLCQQLNVTMDEAVASMEKHLEEAKAYYKVNIVPKLDVLRAEEKLADLQQKQLLAQNNLTLAKSSLNYTLGVDLGTDYTCEDNAEYGPLSRDLIACQAEALKYRPELIAINAQIDMARQAVLIAKSGYKPTVAIIANHQHYDPENSSPSQSVGVIATMKLFDSGMVWHQIREAEDTLEQAQTGQELLQRGIKLEVEQAYHNVEVSLKTIEVAQKSLDTAKETLQVSDTRYKVGLSTSLERLDAEVGLTQAKTNYTQALSMYHIALAELDRAIGKRTND